jgi:hypothetical protein
MTTSKGLGISIKYGDHSQKIELRVNQHALGVRVPQGDNLRPALLRKLLSYCRVARRPCGRPALSELGVKVSFHPAQALRTPLVRRRGFETGRR